MSKELTLDEAEWMVKVVGAKRIARHMADPLEDWPLTPRMITLLKSGPHGILPANEDFEEYLWEGIVTLTRYVIRCNCGKKFTAKLPSQAHALHRAHTGTADRSNSITAEMVSA